MIIRTTAVAAIGLCVTACIPQIPTPGPPSAGPWFTSSLDVTAITPTAKLKVGRVYRDGAGSGIRLANGAVLSEICEDDFLQTNALKLVDAGVARKDAGSNGGSYSQNMTIKPKIGGLGWDLIIGTVGGGYSTDVKIDYTKLTSVETGPGTREIILGAIGSDCRKTIAAHQKARRKVYILTRAIRTDEATVTLTGDAGLEFGTARNAGQSGANTNVSTPSGTVGGKNTEVFKQNLVFLGVNMGDPVIAR